MGSRNALVFKSHLVEERLIQSCVFSLQFVHFFVELCFDVGAFDLEVLKGVNASLHHLR